MAIARFAVHDGRAQRSPCGLRRQILPLAVRGPAPPVAACRVLRQQSPSGIDRRIAFGVGRPRPPQERTPDRLQEQVNTLIESLQTVAPGAGYALGTLVAAAASPRAAYGLAVAGALAAFVFAAPQPPAQETSSTPNREEWTRHSSADAATGRGGASITAATPGSLQPSGEPGLLKRNEMQSMDARDNRTAWLIASIESGVTAYGAVWSLADASIQ